ncbi:hypothetical protein MB02_10645 [Croceicoccus estronivorus]|uniref:hypothetical protein n=1 Tax=Croceicoccus estronivorus TaxID=1172626 RepID=UPI00083064F6|nr:hypothetical protein [Croceicoccus estronivorus]OCC23620.1 hypothetical protein MB02_10645 [Croceicoccus estronivorus]
MMSVYATVRGALAFILALSIAGCGDGASDSQASGEAPAGNQIDGSRGDEGLLGRVNLPRPDWFPAGMPFPNDAHIYLATHIRRDDEPDMFMLQANSFVEPVSYARAFYDWAEAKGLKPERDSRYDLVVGFDGADGSPATLQVLAKDGYTQIVIAYAGQL